MSKLYKEREAMDKLIAQVDGIIQNDKGISVHDLPDYGFFIHTWEGMTAEEIAAEAIDAVEMIYYDNQLDFSYVRARVMVTGNPGRSNEI